MCQLKLGEFHYFWKVWKWYWVFDWCVQCGSFPRWESCSLFSVPEWKEQRSQWRYKNFKWKESGMLWEDWWFLGNCSWQSSGMPKVEWGSKKTLSGTIEKEAGRDAGEEKENGGTSKGFQLQQIQAWLTLKLSLRGLLLSECYVCQVIAQFPITIAF